MYYATHIRTKPTHTCIHLYPIWYYSQVYIFYVPRWMMTAVSRWQSKSLTRKSNSYNNNNDAKNEIHQWEMSNDVFRWQDTSIGSLNAHCSHPVCGKLNSPLSLEPHFSAFFRLRSNRHHTNVLENTDTARYYVFMCPNITIILILSLLCTWRRALYDISVGFSVCEWICLKNWNMHYIDSVYMRERVCMCVCVYGWQYVCSYEFNSLCRLLHVICLQIVFCFFPAEHL